MLCEISEKNMKKINSSFGRNFLVFEEIKHWKLYLYLSTIVVLRKIMFLKQLFCFLSAKQ